MEAHSLQMIRGNGRSSVIRIIEADENFLSRRVCKIWTSDYSHSHSWPSVRMEQLCFHLADFNEMWYFSIFWHVEKIQASLKYYNNNGYFTRRSVSLHDISLNLLKMRNVSDKSCRASPNTFCVRDVVFFNAYSCHLLGASFVTILKSNICTALITRNNTENNFIVSHAQNTTALYFNLLLTD